MIDICDFACGLSRQLYGLSIASERPGHRMAETWHPLGHGRRDQRVQLPGRGLGVELRARRRLRRLRWCGSRPRRRRSPRSRVSRSSVVRARASRSRGTPAPEGLSEVIIGDAQGRRAARRRSPRPARQRHGLDAHGSRHRSARRSALRSLAARARRQQRDDRHAFGRSRSRRARRSLQRRRHVRAALHVAASAHRAREHQGRADDASRARLRAR